VQLRIDGERFLDTFRRVGLAPFKARVYDDNAAENRTDTHAIA
jgi:hypothetical protein